MGLSAAAKRRPAFARQSLKTASGIVHGAAHGSGLSTIQLGLLLLIATPVARVIFAAVGFAIERDYLYVGITLVVLAGGFSRVPAGS